MKKRKVRCYKGYAESGGVYNNEVVYTIPSGHAYFILATCILCGDVFVVDMENPESADLTLSEIAGQKRCPRCGSALSESIRPYPEMFLSSNKCLGSFIPSTQIPLDSESQIVELWELLPGADQR